MNQAARSQEEEEQQDMGWNRTMSTDATAAAGVGLHSPGAREEEVVVVEQQ
jgi:hypothetical protein